MPIDRSRCGRSASAARHTAGAVVAALGIRDAVIHLELFRRGDQWVFLEIACRHGGVSVVDRIRRSYGVDLIEESHLANVQAPTALATRRETASQSVDGAGASGWLIVPMTETGPHTVLAMQPPELVPSLEEATLPQVGDQVDDAFRPFPTLGSFLFAGNDEAQVEADMRTVIKTFEIHLEPVALRGADRPHLNRSTEETQ